MEPVNLICFDCTHFRRFDGRGGCDAFHDGIPDVILAGKDKHSKPIPGQGNDLVFEQQQNNSLPDKFTIPICFDCRHYDGGATYKCKAFPKGIPETILLGRNNHSKPLPGQGNDLVFEQVT